MEWTKDKIRTASLGNSEIVMFHNLMHGYGVTKDYEIFFGHLLTSRKPNVECKETLMVNKKFHGFI